MLRWLTVALLACLVVVPAAAAFANSHDHVSLTYDATKAPVLIGAGRLDASGAIHGGLVVASRDESRVPHIPRLELTATRNGTVFIDNVTDATLVVHSGALLW